MRRNHLMKDPSKESPKEKRERERRKRHVSLKIALKEALEHGAISAHALGEVSGVAKNQIYAYLGNLVGAENVVTIDDMPPGGYKDLFVSNYQKLINALDPIAYGAWLASLRIQQILTEKVSAQEKLKRLEKAREAVAQEVISVGARLSINTGKDYQGKPRQLEIVEAFYSVFEGKQRERGEINLYYFATYLSLANKSQTFRARREESQPKCNLFEDLINSLPEYYYDDFLENLRGSSLLSESHRLAESLVFVSMLARYASKANDNN